MLSKIKELMKDAHLKINEADAESEASRIGTFRAGSTGAILDDGRLVAAGCGRLAQARFLGKQQAPTAEMRAMFVGGFALEDHIEKQLQATGTNYRREEGIRSELDAGLFVNGRPDFDIEIGGEWVGVEVKSLASPFSVEKQVKSGFPTTKHLLQAATYIMLLKRDKWFVVIGNSFNVRNGGFAVQAGTRWYLLTKKDGHFFVENENGAIMQCMFTEANIIAYYRALNDGVKGETLLQRPHNLGVTGEKLYNLCDARYCHMSSQCNLYDTGQIDFQTWISRVPLNKENPGGTKSE